MGYEALTTNFTFEWFIFIFNKQLVLSVMNTTNMSHGIVHDKDGVIMEFNCNNCSHLAILSIGNADVGNPQLIARINWVQKVVPYVPTAIDKVNSYSLTGYSKKLKQHADKYDLWDVEIGSDAHVPFNAKDYS